MPAKKHLIVASGISVVIAMSFVAKNTHALFAHEVEWNVEDAGCSAALPDMTVKSACFCAPLRRCTRAAFSDCGRKLCDVRATFTCSASGTQLKFRPCSRRLSEALEQSAQSPDRVGADGIENVEELQHVEPALAAFDLGDKGLRPLQALGEVVLGEAGFPARLAHDGAERALIGAVEFF